MFKNNIPALVADLGSMDQPQAMRHCLTGTKSYVHQDVDTILSSIEHTKKNNFTADLGSMDQPQAMRHCLTGTKSYVHQDVDTILSSIEHTKKNNFTEVAKYLCILCIICDS